jgi:2-dehydro-3-deoxyglucarate aldolase
MKQLRGTWQQLPNTTVSEILCHSSDLDFVCLDTEHGVFNEETIFQCIQVIQLSGKKVFVRVTEPNKTLVRHYLDAGVDGIIFSTVHNKEIFNTLPNCSINGAPSASSDLKAALDYIITEINHENSQIQEIQNQTTFPHIGKRGYGLTRDNFWGAKNRKEKPLIIAQIENTEGVYQLSCNYNEWSTIFDYFLIGPYDLSSSLGIPGDFSNSLYKDEINRIKGVVPKDKLGYHIVKDIEDQITDYGDVGLLALGMDTLMLLDGVHVLEDCLKVNSIK